VRATDTVTQQPAAREFTLAWDVVQVHRAGDGPPLLWLHGSHLGGRWLPFHARLAQRADVIAPTHPGFREGTPPVWLEGLDDLALLYRQLLDDLDLAQVHVGGHGLGAWLAAEIAVLAPARVQSLSLVAPFGLRVPGQPLADFLAAAPERLVALLFGDEGAQTGAAVLGDLAEPTDYARLYGEHGVTARLMWERRYDLRLERRLPLVTVPALVVQPAADAVVPGAHAARWTELLPSSRLKVLDGAPHGAVATHPDQLATAVLEHVL